MIGVGPSSLLHADRHSRGDSGLAVDHARERVAGDAQDLRAFGYIETERPGYGGFFMGMALAPFF